MFSIKQTKWLRELKSTINVFIDAKIFKPLDKPTVDFLNNTMWIIGTSWHSFVDSRGKNITMKEVEAGIGMLHSLLKPYSSESVIDS